MRIAMIGSGYVGLVSAACFSDFGHRVTCIDKDAERIAQLEQGKLPIFEPGLDFLIATNVAAGRLFFTTEGSAAIAAADAVFLAVGTPSRRGDGFADLSYVYEAAREVAAEMTGFTVVVTKSTVPVATNDQIEAIIRKAMGSAFTRPVDIRNFCAWGPRSRTSSVRIESSWGPRMNGHGR